MKHLTKRQWIFLILAVLMMAFIFFQSALPADLSSEESNGLSLLAAHLFHWNEDIATFLVRKAGHFTEYLILGVFLMLARMTPDPPTALTAAGKESVKDPGDPLPDELTDHSIEQGMSETTLSRQAFATEKKKNRHRVFLTWLIGTAYAATDEFHQLFVEGRSGETRDVCIDSAGVLCGVLIVLFVRTFRQRSAA